MKNNAFILVLLLGLSFLFPSCNGEGLINNNIMNNTFLNTAWISSTEHDVTIWGDYNVSYDKSYDKIFFMEDGIGYGRTSTSENDSYFGHSHSTNSFKFTWKSINGGVQIGETKYKLQKDLLVYEGSDWYYRRSTINSDDREWLESVKYYLMDDDERLDFNCNLTVTSIEDKSASIQAMSSVWKYFYEVNTLFVIYPFEHLYERGITSFKLEYKLNTGEFAFDHTQKFTDSFSTQNNFSRSKSIGIWSKTVPVTLTVNVYAYDSKKKKNQEFLFTTFTFDIPNGSSGGGSGTGGGGSTGGGTGGGNDGGSSSIDVVTGGASNITTSTVDLTGSCSLVNGASLSESGILLHTSSAISYNNAQKYSCKSNNFTATFFNLNMKTTYYYQAYAKDNKGNIYYGTVKNFSTAGYSNVSLQKVDLGLSIKWANKNVGSSGPEDIGNKYAWGETSPKSSYNWSNYQWCLSASAQTVSKYCLWPEDGNVDKKSTLELTDDAARVNLGGSWRMPTKSEIFELINNCRWTWMLMNGVYGYKVEGNNGNYIFLPGDPTVSYHDGSYWTSTLSDGFSSSAAALVFLENIKGSVNNKDRYLGFFVRAVCQ